MVLHLRFDPSKLGVECCEVWAPNNDVQQVGRHQVVQRLSLDERMGDDPGSSKLAASLLPMWQFVAELRQAGAADRVVEVARLHCQNLLAVAMPPCSQLAPEFQTTVATSTTNRHQVVRHEEAEAFVQREADGCHVVDQAAVAGASLFCRGVERISALLCPMEQFAHVNAATAQMSSRAVLPRPETLWFSVEVEVRAFPSARVNPERRDVALRLPAMPLRPPVCRRVVGRLPGRR